MNVISGGTSIWDPEIVACPYCGYPCEADFVDVEVGLVQCGPYYCQNCLASQIGPYDKPRDLTEQEQKTGWYAPGAPLGSSVNSIDGVPVSHQVAKAAYRIGLLDGEDKPYPPPRDPKTREDWQPPKHNHESPEVNDDDNFPF